MTQPARILAIAVAALFVGTAAAQRPGHPWQPPRALPLIPPPVDHPALAAQPGMQKEQPKPPAMPATGSTDPSGCPGAPAPAPDPAAAAAKAFREVRIAGDELETAVQRVVKGLDWRSNQLDARATAAATDRPVLWVYALGDLEGFA